MSNASQRHKLEIHGVSNDNIDLGTAPAQVRADNTAMALVEGVVHLALDLKAYFEAHGPHGYTYAITTPPTGLTIDAAEGTLSGTVGAAGTGTSVITVTHIASTDTSNITVAWTIV